MANTQEHLLACLIEECSEVQKLCTKAIRFGLHDYSPFDPTKTPNNVNLAKELNDMLGIIEMMLENGIELPNFDDRNEIDNKITRVKEYMGYARKAGTLE